ncbi:MAG: FAD-binding oxidoreductase [Saprospiraceae bacterium]|nr:FAD-binding oxidoreductase [Saprospiraceae bacterium]
MPEQSFWEVDSYFKKADYVVIGGGIVGLNAVLQLRHLQPNANIVLIEGNATPLGASTRNAGFACFGSPTELISDLATHDEQTVWNLVQQRWDGWQRLSQKVTNPYMDYEPLGGYEIFKTGEEAIFEQCVAQLDEFNRQFWQITGQRTTFSVVDEQIPHFAFQGVKHLIFSKLEGQLHPAKMIMRLQQLAQAAHIQLFFGLKIKQLDEHPNEVQLHFDNGWTLCAEKVLVATNGFAQQLMPHLAVQAARNQVLITKPISGLSLKGCFHYEQGYYYFRNVGNRILLGGGRNLAKEEEQTAEFGVTNQIQQALTNLLHQVIAPHKKVTIERWWSGILGVGELKQPIVEMTSPRIGVAVRMGGMGIAIGSLVGEKQLKC